MVIKWIFSILIANATYGNSYTIWKILFSQMSPTFLKTKKHCLMNKRMYYNINKNEKEYEILTLRQYTKCSNFYSCEFSTC